MLLFVRKQWKNKTGSTQILYTQDTTLSVISPIRPAAEKYSLVDFIDKTIHVAIQKGWASQLSRPVHIVTMFLISMSLVIFCLLFSFVDYVPVKGITIARGEWGGDSGERGL